MNSLHSGANLLAGSKRKRHADPTDYGDWKRVVRIKSCSTAIFQTTVSFTPIRVLPNRACLPLTFLDPLNPYHQGSYVSTRLFRAYMPVLESQPSQSRIIVGRIDTDKTLYAVERVSPGHYAVCKLNTKVTLGDVMELPVWDYPTESTHSNEEVATGNPEWWTQAAISIAADPQTRPDDAQVARPKLAMLRHPPNTTLHGNHFPPQSRAKPPRESCDSKPRSEGNLDDLQGGESAPFNADQTLENLVTQYLDALYLSKTSLAYFVKGPLSRARAAFITPSGDHPGAVDSASTLHSLETTAESRSTKSLLQDLTNFLRGALLPLTTADRKYRERLPTIVRELPLHHSDTEIPARDKKALKRKKNKPLKPAKKDGLYPGEEVWVKRWWYGLSEQHDEDHGDFGRDGEMITQALKRRAAELRVRETLAQVVLACEVLALERSKEWKEEEKLREQMEANINQEEVKKKRRGKKQDLSTLVDLLVDKLCIWQTVDEDNIASTTSTSKGANKTSGLEVTNGSKSKDLFYGFCVEVLIPFYATRLPDLTNSISAKLGGPAAPSPAKRPVSDQRQRSSRSTKDATSTSKDDNTLSKSAAKDQTGKGNPKPKPGAPVSREDRAAAARKTSRMLVRTSTDTATLDRPDRPEGLQRSTTDSAVNGLSSASNPRSGHPGVSIKSERQSAISLLGIPTLPAAAARPSSSASTVKRFASREVDLSALTRQADERLKRKKRIEEEVKRAVQVIRKPNRADALKNAEFGSSALGANKSTVLVEATPSHTRFHAAPAQQGSVSQPVFPAGLSGLLDSPTHVRTSGRMNTQVTSLAPLANDVDDIGIPSSVPLPTSSARARTASRAHATAAETPSKVHRGVHFDIPSSASAAPSVSHVSGAADTPINSLETPIKRKTGRAGLKAGIGARQLFSTPIKGKGKTGKVPESVTKTTVTGTKKGRKPGGGEKRKVQDVSIEDVGIASSPPVVLAPKSMDAEDVAVNLSHGKGMEDGGLGQPERGEQQEQDIYAMLGWNDF